MTRFAQQDFIKFQTYINDYSIKTVLISKTREDLLKCAHKNTLAAFQIWVILESAYTAGQLKFYEQSVPVETENFNQLSECFSDLNSAIFASIHGLYKPAFMSLRSAIETFVRGISGITSQEAKNTTSISRLFELAADQPVFQEAGKKALTELKKQYGELCSHTHSATPAHMGRSFALANYPRHDTTKLKELTQRNQIIIQSILSILIYSNKKLYLLTPPKARDLLDEIIPSDARLSALGAY